MTWCNFQIRPYSYNSVWQGPLDRAISNWNGTATPVWITKNSAADNWITAAQYAETYYGRYTTHWNLGRYFDIKLNSRTIAGAATNISNFITSVFVHELGHALSLAHNSETSIMNDGRNRNSMTTPQAHDISDVNSTYGPGCGPLAPAANGDAGAPGADHSHPKGGAR
jgi:predicted Zn-dependent protease